MTVKDITQAFEVVAPRELADNWDNVGLLAGDFEQDVKKVFLCLDVTSEVISEAIEFNADLIIAHHPLIMSPLTRVIEQDVVGRIIRSLTKNDISVYVAHTNFDLCDGGLNDILAEKLELTNIRPFTSAECLDELGKPMASFGRVSNCSATTLGEFVKFVEKKLNVSAIRFVGDENKKIEKVATVSGAGGDMLYAAFRAGVDVFVAADIKHHVAQMATELGVAVVDAGHFETEVLMCEFVEEFLHKKFPGIEIGISTARSFFR